MTLTVLVLLPLQQARNSVHRNNRSSDRGFSVGSSCGGAESSETFLFVIFGVFHNLSGLRIQAHQNAWVLMELQPG